MGIDKVKAMERKIGLDFARILSAVGIISFHFYCHSSSQRHLFYGHANGMWGGTLNYLFFALSGLVLHLKYREDGSIKLPQFYLKRWKSVIPAYVIVWFFAYCINVTKYGSFFYLGIPKRRMLLTLIGMDGYASWVIPTYFITGEWFLGAVLVAYMCYPILRRMIKKNALVSFAILFAIYEIRLCVSELGIAQYFPLNSAVAPSTCIFSFFVGMMLAEHFEMLKKPPVIMLSALCCAIGLLVPFKGNNIPKELIIGCAILVCMYNLGEVLCRKREIRAFVTSLSGLTYYTFLLHHRIIYRILEKFDFSDTSRAFIVLCVAIVVTFVLAKILDVVMKDVMRSRIVRSIDAKVYERE